MAGDAVSRGLCRALLALDTVKWHLKNLYGKVGVNSRSAALAKARSLPLIPRRGSPMRASTQCAAANRAAPARSGSPDSSKTSSHNGYLPLGDGVALKHEVDGADGGTRSTSGGSLRSGSAIKWPEDF
jgi:hypothetical protein